MTIISIELLVDRKECRSCRPGASGDERRGVESSFVGYDKDDNSDNDNISVMIMIITITATIMMMRIMRIKIDKMCMNRINEKMFSFARIFKEAN